MYSFVEFNMYMIEMRLKFGPNLGPIWGHFAQAAQRIKQIKTGGDKPKICLMLITQKIESAR